MKVSSYRYAAFMAALLFSSSAVLAQAPIYDAGVPVEDYSNAPATAEPVSAPAEAAPQSSPALSNSPPPVNPQPQGEVFYQLQLLQQEVMELRGLVEEQAYQINQLKQQGLERYVELDKRIGSMVGAGATNDAATNGAKPNGDLAPQQPAKPGEADAYRAAYALVKGQQFDLAVSAFDQFLGDFPEGRYRPNAYYWLGELYLVVEPQQLELARQSFVRLVDQYPDHSKIPDALYKLGKVQFLKGNREKAKSYLDQVVQQYGGSSSSAPKLAKQFLQENF